MTRKSTNKSRGTTPRWLERLAPLLLVVTGVVVTGVAAASAASTADGALARMRARQESLRTLAASVEQTKSFPQLGIEDPPERGQLYLERGRGGETRMRLEINSPETRVLVVDEHGYLLYQPRIKQAVEGSFGDGGAGASTKGVFTGVLTGSEAAAEALERDYRVVELAPGHLRFEARQGASVHCQLVELWLDASTDLPRKQSCHEANRSVVTITLEDVVIDGELPAKVFEVAIPSDVERVKG